MKLFGNRKHRKQPVQHPAEPVQPLLENTDMSATAILDEVQLEVQAMEAAAQTAAPEKAPEAAQPEGDGKKHRLTGLQKGLLILAAAILLLGLTGFIIYRALVKPPAGTIDGTNAAEIIGRVEENLDDEPEDPMDSSSILGVEVRPETVYDNEEDARPDRPAREQMDIQAPIESEAVETLDGRYTVLLCGTDGDGGRTDTIMLASFDLNEKTVNVLSVPRDTMVQSGSRVQKVNAVYARGGKGAEGMEYLAAKLTTMLGIPINAYALIDLKAFVEVVDLIGGVWFDVPQDMNYDDPWQDLYIHLTKGYQLLDGEKCMELVRFRSYATGDIQRVSVQQDFLKAVIDQCLAIGNVTKVSEIARIINANLTTNLTLGNMVYLGTNLLSVDLNDVSFYTLPGVGMTYSDGGAYYVLYRYDTVNLLNEAFNPYSYDLTTANVDMVYYSNGSIILPGRSYTSGSSGTSTRSAGTTASTPAPAEETPEEPAEGEEPAEPTEEEPEEVFVDDPAEGSQTETQAPEETAEPAEDPAPAEEPPASEPEPAPSPEPEPEPEPAPTGETPPEAVDFG